MQQVRQIVLVPSEEMSKHMDRISELEARKKAKQDWMESKRQVRNSTKRKREELTYQYL